MSYLSSGEGFAPLSGVEISGLEGAQTARSRWSVREYDLYINSRKPTLVVYVPSGASLKDFANPGEWVFDGTTDENALPANIVESVESNGHAFRVMD